MRLTAGAASDVGRLRSLNEDSLLVTADVFAVADGMGGHRSGEVASARALEAFGAAATDPTLERLMGAVQAANRDVFEHARTSPDLAGMGTTLCAIAPVDDHHVAVVNVGDSRVYLLRAGELHQVSEDHSFVESLVRDGRLTRAQADVHPQRNVLTRALGIEPDIDVDGWEVEAFDGDRFLLCSDGLFNEVADRAVSELLGANPDPGQAAGALVEAANLSGGRDNITCVVVDVSETGRDAPAAADTGAAASPPIEDSLVKRTSNNDFDATTLDEPTLGARSAATAVTADPTAATPSQRPRRISWRTVAFLLAIVLTFAVAFGAIDVYYRHSYSVADRSGEVVVYKGPATKKLWVTPRLVVSSGLQVSELTKDDRTRVQRGREGLSRNEALTYVNELRRRATTEQATAATSTTTAPTSTTIATTAAAPSTTASAAPAGG